MTAVFPSDAKASKTTFRGLEEPGRTMRWLDKALLKRLGR